MTVPSSSPSEPPQTPAASSSPLALAARDRERDRLLTLANVQRMRGQLDQARESLQAALALNTGAPKADAQIHEMLGDAFAQNEKWDEAKAAYETAYTLDNARASAERKFAQTVLRVADATRERAVAEAMLRGELPPGAGAIPGGVGGKRSPVLALLLSCLAPGFGQLYNGQLVKGLVCLGVFLVGLIAINLSPDGRLLFQQIVPLAFGRIPLVRGEISPGLIALLILCSAMWLYAILDAPIVASKLGNNDNTPGAPKIDKSGWEV